MAPASLEVEEPPPRKWMPMVDSCATLADADGSPGHVRLMFPPDSDQPPSSWVRERLVAVDHASRSYTYEMEDGNVGLAGSRNTISVFDYDGGGRDGEEAATLVVWNFEVDAVDGANQDALLDYLRILYKSCIHAIPSSY